MIVTVIVVVIVVVIIVVIVVVVIECVFDNLSAIPPDPPRDRRESRPRPLYSTLLHNRI